MDIDVQVATLLVGICLILKSKIASRKATTVSVRSDSLERIAEEDIETLYSSDLGKEIVG